MKQAGKLFGDPANPAVLCALKRLLPADIPADYLSFLTEHDGADFWPDEGAWVELGFDYLRLDDAERVLADQLSGVYSDSPELIVIGSDGGGQWLAFDCRISGAYPLVMYCPGGPLDSNYRPVARSITELAEKYTK